MTDAIATNDYRLEFQEALKDFADRARNLEGRTPIEQLNIQDLKSFLRHYESASDMALESAIEKYPDVANVIRYADKSDAKIDCLAFQETKTSLNKNRRLTDFLESAFREHLEKEYSINITGDFRLAAILKSKLICHVAQMLDENDKRNVAQHLNTIKATRFIDAFIEQLNLLAPGLSQSIATPSALHAA